MKSIPRSVLIISLILLLIILAIGYVIQHQNRQPETLSLYELREKIEAGEVISVVETGNGIDVIFRDGRIYFLKEKPQGLILQHLLDIGTSPDVLSSDTIRFECRPSTGDIGLLLVAVSVGSMIGMGLIVSIRRSAKQVRGTVEGDRDDDNISAD